MSSILPDKKLEKRIIFIVAIVAAIAIPSLIKFREVRQAPPQQSPTMPKETSDQNQLDSSEKEYSDEMSDIREHTIQETDRQFLIEQGLRNPINDLVADLMKHNELILCEGSVGGTPGFYSPNRIAVLSKDHVIADYEDGHDEGTIELTFIVSRGTISWKVVHSECGN
jgi:hypothetical protein